MADGDFAGFGGGGWSNAWGSAGGAYAGLGGASDWSKLMNAINSKEGREAMGGLGKGLLSAAGGTGGDASFLRTNAGAAPFSPGGQNSLLATLLQMRVAEMQRANPLAGIRPGLLG
jgi:hypothetical protein